MKIIQILAFLFMLMPALAMGAFRSSRVPPDPPAACNPRPSLDDLSLPMPCGLTLALRAVPIPGIAPLGDRRFSMGTLGNADDERSFYERQHEGYIGAPFSAADLPEDWRSKIGQGRGSFYFIGKYELSNLQWQAVMDSIDADGAYRPESCPQAGKDSALPKSGVSWFDVQDFLRRYNLWLLREHAATLPRFSGSKYLAFMRLPTEEEWEFAARGGMNVPTEWWVDNDFFPMNGKKTEDYGVFSGSETYGSPLPIGSRNANPLGLHDTMGNLREMTDSFFRLAVADGDSHSIFRRLHGSAGGLVAKGGSFRSLEPETRPGARDESPFFTENGTASAADLGLRLALGGLNIPGAQRLADLRRGEGSTPQADAFSVPSIEGLPPLQALDQLSRAARDREMREALVQLRQGIADQESAQARQKQEFLENSLRSLLYQQEAIRAYALRLVSSSEKLAELDNLLAKPMDQATRQKAQAMRGQLENDIKGFRQTILLLGSHYLKVLGEQAGADGASAAAMIAQFRNEYGSAGVFGEHMRQNIDSLEKHIKSIGHAGRKSPQLREALKDIVPRRHYTQLKLWN